MPIKILNVSNRLVNLIAKIEVGDLLPIETNKQHLCLTIIFKNQNKQLILKIIDSSLKDEASMLTKQNKK